MNAKQKRNVTPGQLICFWEDFKAIAVLALFVLVPAAAWSQGTTATLNGTVQDRTGALIVNAKVEVMNEATGDTRRTTSNGSGFFAFSALPSGDYDVEIDSIGFKKDRETGIHLDPGDTRTLRQIKLSVGSENTSVTVTAAGEAIDTDSGAQSTVISAEDIKNLSVEGRDVTELLKTLPGFSVNPLGGSQGSVTNAGPDPSQVTVRGGEGSYSSNGTLQNSVAILSDGADITDPGDFGGTMQTINYDQVAEVKVETSSFSADEARGPVVVSAVGRSGGKQYHGSLYTYARTYQLDSEDWLAKYTGQGKPPDRQVYPGFTFGGPIRIPGTRFNRGKKLTFFVGAEEYAQRNVYAYGNVGSATMTGLVPTAGMRTGDFSPAQLAAYLGPSYTPIAGGPSCSGTYANVCYAPQQGPGDQTLANYNIGPYLDPAAMQEINVYPLPNSPSNGEYNWIHTNFVDNDEWQAKGRIDYDISEKNKLFAVYDTQRGTTNDPQEALYSLLGPMGGVNTPGGGINTPLTSQLGTVNLTSILTPRLTNEFYFSGIQFAENWTPKTPSAVTGGPGGFADSLLFNNGAKSMPWLEDFGYNLGPLSLLPELTAAPFQRKFIRTAGDNVTKVLGSHTLRGGFFFQMDTQEELEDPEISFLPTNGAISQYYVGGETTNLDPTVNGGLPFYSTGSTSAWSGGNYLADFMEGQIYEFQQTNVASKSDLYFFNIDGYIQDHWQIKPRLSLDLGLRLEHMTPWGDAHNVGIPVWNAANYAKGFPATLPGWDWHAIDKSVPVGGFKTAGAYVEPRFGFAWDFSDTGNSVLRGGFGVYRSHDPGDIVTPYLNQTTVDVTQTVLSQIHLQAAAATSTPSGFVPDGDYSGVDGNDDQEPQTYTWNLDVDQRLPANSFLEIAYVGNHSDKLLNYSGGSLADALDNINAMPIGTLYGPQPVTGTSFPFFPPAGGAAGATGNALINLNQSEIDSFRPYPLYQQLHVSSHTLYANYDGLQVSLRKQIGKLLYGFNYTWSHALGVVASERSGVPLDPFHTRNNYLDEGFDRRNVFNATYAYNFGTVVRNRWMSPLTNGWELSGITTIQGGASLQSSMWSPNFNLQGTINMPQGSFAVGPNTLLGTPDVSLQPTLSCDPGVHVKPHQYINSACFALNPNLGQNGVYRFPRITGPALTDSDLTAMKTFKVTDKSNLQFRFAAFNFLNHANTTFDSIQQNNYTLNFNGAFTGTSIPANLAASTSQNSNFGLTSLRTGRRIMEMSLKYSF